MKILLTGAEGQVGREVVQAFPSVVALAKSDLDITQLSEVKNAISQHQPDVIINAAAYTAVDKAEEEQDLAFAVNRDGVKNLALACREHHVPLIHLSTDYVFDGTKDRAYQEDDPIAPINIYGQSKAEGEQALREILAEHIIVRVSWIFGRYGRNFVKTMLKLADEKKELNIVSDQIGCPTPARDIAVTLIKLAEAIQDGKAQWGTFHYCGAKPLSWYEFAQVILQDKNVVIKAIASADFKTAAKRPKNSVMNVEKIKNAYGVEAPDWRKALETLKQEMKVCYDNSSS